MKNLCEEYSLVHTVEQALNQLTAPGGSARSSSAELGQGLVTVLQIVDG
jgi:hypothetical protein